MKRVRGKRVVVVYVGIFHFGEARKFFVPTNTYQNENDNARYQRVMWSRCPMGPNPAKKRTKKVCESHSKGRFRTVDLWVMSPAR